MIEFDRTLKYLAPWVLIIINCHITTKLNMNCSIAVVAVVSYDCPPYVTFAAVFCTTKCVEV